MLKNFILYRIINFCYRRKGSDLKISRKANLISKKNISLGSSVTILENTKIDAHSGAIEIGDRSYIDRNVLISAHGGWIKIGSKSSLNPNCCVYGHGGLSIGNHVRIAAGTVIIPSNHGYSRTDIPISEQKSTNKGIKIEDDVWIGANCVILDGVTIGKSCIIGAGSVVSKSIPPFSVACGVPAKPIRSRL